MSVGVCLYLINSAQGNYVLLKVDDAFVRLGTKSTVFKVQYYSLLLFQIILSHEIPLFKHQIYNTKKDNFSKMVTKILNVLSVMQIFQ